MGESTIHILLIEDEKDHAKLVCRAFERYAGRFSLTVAGNLEQARAYLAESLPDLVIADWLLPDGRGTDLLPAAGEVRRFPLIVMTSHGNEQVAVGAMKAGALDYVIKSKTPLGDMPRVAERALREWGYIVDRQRAEESLRASEERYRTMIENANDIIWTLDTEGHFTFVNHQAEIISGYKSEEGNGKLFTPPIYPDDLEMVNEVFRKTLSGESHQYTVRCYKKNGEIFILSVNTAPIYEKSKVVGTVSFGRDITERVRAEQALQESEAKFRRISENTPAIVYQFKMAPDGTFTFPYVSETIMDILGIIAEDVMQDSFTLIGRVHPEDQKMFLEGVLKSAETLETYHEIFRCLKDGKVMWVECRTTPNPMTDGSILWDGFFVDITERKQAEEERELLLAQIREQAKQMQQTIATVPEGVLLLDTAQRVILANPVAEGDLAVLAAAQVGDRLTRLGDRPLAELLTSPPTKGVWHEVKADGRTFEVIARPMEPALKPVVSLSNHLPNGNGPEPENWVLVIRDVTQEREIQRRTQQQERLVALGQLAAGVAHDFNNIMTTIILYTQMSLNAPDLPSKIRQRLETVSGQAYRATDLVQQILDFSRRAVLERRPMDLTPFLKEVVKVLERTVPESIEIEFTYGADEYTVHADPTRVQQAIINLALNARDAMLSQGGGELRIELKRVQIKSHEEPPLPEMEAGEWVRVQVSDTGSGITPDVLPHIFEPFFTTKEVGQGTGLGLAQVYGIVKQHKGHIDVSTEVGTGATFTLYLPALLASPPESPAQAPTALIQGQGETVLVVEDNAALREALADSLEMLSYQVLKAANGREALDTLEQHADEIALVLTDVVMPEMGGQALFHTLRQRDPNLPVVMLTGHPLEKELENLKAQGLAGWLLKPPDLEQLAQLLAQALKDKK